MNNRRMLAVIGAVVVLMLTWGFVGQAAAQPGDAEWNRQVKEVIEKLQKGKDDREKERIKAGRAQVDALLLELEDVYKKGGEEEAKIFAAKRRRKLRTKDDNKVEVYLVLKPTVSAEQYDKTTLLEYGCVEIFAISDGSLRAEIPIGMISKIAEIQDMAAIVIPQYGVPE